MANSVHYRDRACLDGMRGYPYVDDDNSSRIQSTPESVFRKSVRHLLLYEVSLQAANFIISASSSVEDLWILAERHSLLPIIGALPLKRLHCSLQILFGHAAQIDFAHPLFSRLTHLELFDTVPWTGVTDLALIPHLSHLCFTQNGFLSDSLPILSTCKSLRVLVFLTLDESDPPRLVEEYSALTQLAKDPRFVMMACDNFDWQMGALTGTDYWSRAEDFIAKRVSGQIDPLQYMIEGDESENLV
ncbi:hypothetical protein DFH07DRAFT_958827 [Mycena maculata]|uniref:Uncharacterized protein n=1 Tax=Mycena maculata TaxID=230809 RepID=A0AAD7J6K0_9AGAR|nr:hypothetical protein DFH07DRAFT_958827 [Mycena maculata]